MKYFKLLVFTACIIGFTACGSQETPTYEVTTSDLTFISGDYYGDDNDDGIAKFVIALSIEYDKTKITKASGEVEATDVLYLTIFSDIALDAEEAMPKAGKYDLSSDKGLFVLQTGQSKATDKDYVYEGSYVVSTIDGVENESRITGGNVEVSYVEDKCVFKLDLLDENGYLAKYAEENVALQCSDAVSYANKAIVYHIFNNPGYEYNRCWYWGEPPSSLRDSEDGTPVGEYLFAFSNAANGVVANEGEVYATFSLTDEFHFYGLDRKVKPGVYPVNQDGIKGKLGTLFKYDLTHPNASNSGTVRVKVLEGGVSTYHFVTSGWLAVLGDENGTPNKFIVNFTRQDGKKFHGRYDGELYIGDEWTISDFRENVDVNNLSGAYMRIIDPAYRYQVAGTNQWELFLTGSGASVSIDEQYGYAVISGPGDCFRFEISTDASVVDALTAGTYPIEDSFAAGIAQQGSKSMAWMGLYTGAWFHRLLGGGEFKHSIGISGSLTISKNGSQYTMEVTLYDDAKNTITGNYTGVPIIEDHRTSASGVRRPDFNIGKLPAGSPEYISNYVERFETAKARLK